MAAVAGCARNGPQIAATRAAKLTPSLVDLIENGTALRPRTRRETPFLGAVSSPDGLMESQMAYVPPQPVQTGHTHTLHCGDRRSVRRPWQQSVWIGRALNTPRHLDNWSLSSCYVPIDIEGRPLASFHRSALPTRPAALRLQGAGRFSKPRRRPYRGQACALAGHSLPFVVASPTISFSLL